MKRERERFRLGKNGLNGKLKHINFNEIFILIMKRKLKKLTDH